MAGVRLALRAAAIAALLWAGHAHAQAPEAGRTSTARVDGASLPALVHVVPIRCGSGLLDIPAFASALRVELMQQGVRVVDVVRPDTSPSDVPATVVELRAVPCDSSARAMTFTIRGPGPTAPGRSGTIGLGDVDFASRPRVAALAVAEAFEVAQDEANASPALTPRGPASGQAPGAAAPVASSMESNAMAPSAGPATPPKPPSSAGAGTPVAPSIESNSAPSALPVAPAIGGSTNIPLGGSSPAPLAPPRDSLVLSAMFDVRDFTAYATGLLGPRADLALSPRGAGLLRLHVDAGAAFGSVYDALGDVELTLVSGAASLTLFQGVGALSFEIGPRVEVGWVDARGLPISPGARPGRVDGTFAAASLVAALGVQWSAHWRGMFSFDVGDAFAGLQARSDDRPTAGTIGPMLAARVGFSYGL